MDNQAENQLILTDKDGNEVTLTFLDLVEYREEEYVVTLPPDEPTVLILKMVTAESGEECLAPITDEHVLDAVFNIFRNRHKELFAPEEGNGD